MKKTLVIMVAALLFISLNIGNASAWVRLGYIPPSSNVSYSIHSSFPSSQYNTVISASNTWNEANAKFKFTCGTVPSYATLIFGNNTFHVAMIDFSLYGWPINANGAHIYDSSSSTAYGDILLNSKRTWGNGSSSSYLDYQGILTHEFGHAAGLGDVYSSGDITVGSPGDYALTTMYAHSDYSTNNSYGMRTLEADDIAGLKGIWP